MEQQDYIEHRNSNGAKKLVSILFLIGLLIVSMLYLEFFENSSLFDIFSLLLGFVFCLLFQLRLISHYFREQMDDLDLNQFGMIKLLIKSKIFGELNQDYVHRKNKIKYYMHTKTKKDPLFNDENKETFDEVMAKMRVNSQLENYQRIRTIRAKWDAIVFKIGLLDKLFNQLHRIYKERSNCYKNYYNNTISKHSPEQLRGWNVLFVQNPQTIFQPEQNKLQINEYLEGYEKSGMDWFQLNYLIAQRVKMTDKKVLDISERVIKECSLYYEEIKNHRKEGLAKLQLLDDEYAEAKKKTKQNKDKIQEKKNKIEIATKKIKQNKLKNDDNMEIIFATQYELRLLNFDLEKLEIKKSYDYDMLLKKSQSLHKLCVQEDKKIDSEEIFAFNKKILNYIDAIYDAQKFLHDKLVKHTTDQNFECQFMDYEDLLSVDWIINKHKQLQKKKMKSKQYFFQLKTFLKQIQVNLTKSSKIIQSIQKQMTNHFINENQSVYIVHEKIHDTFLLSALKKISEKENQTLNEFQRNVDYQIQLFLKHEEEVNQITMFIFSSGEEYNRISKNIDKDKKGKTTNNFSLQSVQLRNTMKNKITMDLIQKFKVYSQKKALSNSVEIIKNLLTNQYQVYKYIQSRKEELELKSQDYQKQDITLKKMHEYHDQLFKQQMKEQEEQNLNYVENNSQENNKDEQKQKQDRSLAIVNKLLSVFFEQWSNSEFFHQILKEEIEKSLNKKKPSFVSYITVKYIKLVEKQGDLLEGVNKLSEDIFICNLEAIVDFSGKIAVHVETSIRHGSTHIPINVYLLIRKFYCPIRVCFNPFSLGKSYGSLMKIPKLSIEIDVQIGKWNLTKLPFISKILKTVIIIKLRKKMLWPKRFTISVPLAVQNPVGLAIRQSLLFDKQKEKKLKIV